MALGPRLDRPSAVGEEGRPRARSLGVASLVVVAVCLAVTIVVWTPNVLPAVALPVGLITAGVALANREQFVPKFVSYLLFLPAASAVVGFAFLVFLVSDYGFVLLGLIAALLGLSGTWADVANADTLKTAVLQSGLSYVVMLSTMVLLVTVWIVLAIVWEVVGSGGAGYPPGGQLALVAAVTGLTAFAVRVAVWALPIRQLTPQPRRESVARWLATIRFVTLVTALGLLTFAVVTAVLTVLGLLSPIFALAAPLSQVLTVLSSRLVIWPLLAVAGTAIVVTVVTWLLRKATQQFDTWTARWLAVVAAGMFAAPVFPGLVYAFLPTGGIGAVLIAIVLTFVGPLFVLAVAFVAFFLIYFGVLPDRGGGPALAAAGLLALSVGVGDAGGPTLLVLAAAAGAMIAWDVSAFGLGLTAELGHLPDTSRLELFHGLASVGVGVLAVGALSLAGIVTGWLYPTGARPALSIAAVGVLLVLAVLRG